MTDKEVVCPGDQLGVIEEFTPQNNCFEQEGAVFATHIGEKTIDKEKHQVAVMEKRRIYIPRRGSIELGYIT